MARIPTEKQIEASRRNGAQSHGPTTSLGKQMSSLNGFKHGRYAKFPYLTDADDTGAFKLHIQSYRRTYQPANDVEIQLVDTIAACDWQINRQFAIQSRTIDIEQCHNAAELFPGQEAIDQLDHLVAATASIDGRSPLLRHISQEINRLTARRASHLRQLIAQKKLRQLLEMPHTDMPPVREHEDEIDELPEEPENEPQLAEDQPLAEPQTGKLEPGNPVPKLPRSPIGRRLYALAHRRPRPKFRPRT